MSITLSQREQLAAEARAAGANCSQAILAAFPDVINLPSEAAMRIAVGLGGGVGGQGQICGVVSAMAILEGFKSPAGTPKPAVYKAVKSLSEAFHKDAGSLICKELKRPGAAISCDQLIERGVEIFHSSLS